MAALDEDALNVVAAFQRWAKGNDSAEIECFSLDDLKTAETRLGSRDPEAPFRLALKRRIEELERAGDRRSESIVRAVSYIVTFALGALSTIVAEFILRR